MTYLEQVEAEAARAEEKYGPFRSSHEGLGVLLEEFHELTEAIRHNEPAEVQAEAIQVAAVAMRIAEALDLPKVRKRSGM